LVATANDACDRFKSMKIWTLLVKTQMKTFQQRTFFLNNRITFYLICHFVVVWRCNRSMSLAWFYYRGIESFVMFQSLSLWIQKGYRRWSSTLFSHIPTLHSLHYTFKVNQATTQNTKQVASSYITTPHSVLYLESFDIPIPCTHTPTSICFTSWVSLEEEHKNNNRLNQIHSLQVGKENEVFFICKTFFQRITCQ
jgi:hypothetical protein